MLSPYQFSAGMCSDSICAKNQTVKFQIDDLSKSVNFKKQANNTMAIFILLQFGSTRKQFSCYAFMRRISFFLNFLITCGDGNYYSLIIPNKPSQYLFKASDPPNLDFYLFIGISTITWIEWVIVRKLWDCWLRQYSRYATFLFIIFF